MEQIKRYTFAFTDERNAPEENALGEYVAHEDHESDKQQAITAAVQAERERCWKEEVTPLLDVLDLVRHELDLAEQRVAEGPDSLDVSSVTRVKLVKVLIAVRAVQESKPCGFQALCASRSRADANELVRCDGCGRSTDLEYASSHGWCRNSVDKILCDTCCAKPAEAGKEIRT
jgi:hypothetical protein